MIDDFTKIAEGLSKLGSAYAWPVVVFVILWWFKKPIRDFIANISEGSVKGFGIEAKAKRNAAVEMVKADLKKSDGAPDGLSNLQLLTKAENSIRSADALLSVLPVKELRGKSVLWVDDRPEDTYYERRALTELGIKMDVETDAEGALILLDDKSYDVAVIVPPHILPSDVGALLTARLHAKRIAYIVYWPKTKQEWRVPEADIGAFGIVSDVTDLILFVSSAVRGMRSSDFMQDYVYWSRAVKEATEKLKGRGQ